MADNKVRFIFDEELATQVAAFLLKLNDSRMSYMKAIKLMYIIDREAIRRWYKPITTDKYVAMSYGPVTSRIYDIIMDKDPHAKGIWTSFIRRDGFDIELTRECSVSRLSRIQTDLIREVDSSYKELDQYDMARLTHTFPEWSDPGRSSKPITYEDVLCAVVPEEKQSDALSWLMRGMSAQNSHYKHRNKA